MMKTKRLLGFVAIAVASVGILGLYNFCSG